MRRILPVLFVVLVPRAACPQGSPLGPEFRVNTYTSGDQGAPAIAADSSGNFIVVWNSRQDAGSYGVFGQRYASSGAPLGPEFRVNTYTTDYQVLPSVAADPLGSFVVVWQGYGQDGSGFGVLGQRYDGAGTPLGPEFRVNTYTNGTQGVPSVASDSSGNFVVVWQGYEPGGSTYGIFGQRYASSGSPLGPEFRVNTYTTYHQARPSVASDSSGNFIVVWQSYAQDGSAYGVFGQRYASSGPPLGAEFRVNGFTTAGQRSPSVAAAPSGDFVVVWKQSYGDYIFGQRYASTGAPLGTEFRVSTFTTGYHALPRVAADAGGNFVVVWGSSLQDAGSYGVFGQRYASSGAPQGLEFRINTYTTDLQRLPAVVADASGNFVVVWESGLQDGSLLGVFGQRYGQIVPVELMRFGVE